MRGISIIGSILVVPYIEQVLGRCVALLDIAHVWLNLLLRKHRSHLRQQWWSSPVISLLSGSISSLFNTLRHAVIEVLHIAWSMQLLLSLNKLMPMSPSAGSRVTRGDLLSAFTAPRPESPSNAVSLCCSLYQQMCVKIMEICMLWSANHMLNGELAYQIFLVFNCWNWVIVFVSIVCMILLEKQIRSSDYEVGVKKQNGRSPAGWMTWLLSFKFIYEEE